MTTVLAAGGSTPATVSAGGDRRHLECRPSGRARHPDPAGSVPDQFAVAVAAQRRRDVAARRRNPGRRPRVRRPHHHSSVLVQGDRRRGPDLLCGRPGALRARRRPRGATRAAARHRGPAEAGGAGVLGVSDQARPHRQRRRPRHPGQRHRVTARDARARIHDRRHSRLGRRRRGRVDPRADRARRSRCRLADRRSARRATRSGCRPRTIATGSPRCLSSSPTSWSKHWGPPPGELFVDRSQPTPRARS